MRALALLWLAAASGCSFIDDFSKFEFREGVADAGSPDAGTRDAGPLPDGGPPPPDAGPPDAGPLPDAGPACDPACGPCQVCDMGACRPLAPGEACTDASGAAGVCRGAAVCCTGCWSGSACELGTMPSACGAGGALCESCACDGDTCDGTGCVARSPAETVATGDSHACAVTTAGDLRCWGSNGQGQLGIGTSMGTRAVPVLPMGPAMATWSSVAAGGSHTCAVAVGTEQLYCFGNNGNGQLGTGDRVDRHVPVLVGAARWRRAELGDGFSCAIDLTGTLRCWGGDFYGQLGNGPGATDATAPGPVTRLGPAVQVAAGSTHTCAISADDDTLWCWGLDTTGATAIRDPEPWPYTRHDPVRTGPDGWARVTAGTEHGCGIRTDGALLCWGSNASGRLGLGPTMTAMVYRVPQRVGTEGTWQRVAAGGDFTCAIDAESELVCWGAGAGGRLGFPTAVAVDEPTPVARDDEWTEVAAGTAFACAVNARGHVYCWGANNNQQIARMTGPSYDTPQRVCIP